MDRNTWPEWDRASWGIKRSLSCDHRPRRTAAAAARRVSGSLTAAATSGDRRSRAAGVAVAVLRRRRHRHVGSRRRTSIRSSGVVVVHGGCSSCGGRRCTSGRLLRLLGQLGGHAAGTLTSTVAENATAAGEGEPRAAAAADERREHERVLRRRLLRSAEIDRMKMFTRIKLKQRPKTRFLKRS